MANDTPIGQVIALIIGISIAVLILIFMGLLSGQVYEAQEDDLTEVGSTDYIANESFTANNVTAATLDNPYIIGTPLLTNGTTILDNTNWTIDLTAGTVLALNDTWNGSTVNISYYYRNRTIENSIKAGIISSFEAQQKTADYLPIIVLALIIAIVLSLVLGYAGNMFGRGGGAV